MRKVFSDTKHIKMNGTKSMIGHCLGAAAGLEARWPCVRLCVHAPCHSACLLGAGPACLCNGSQSEPHACLRRGSREPVALCLAAQAVAVIKAIETGWVHPTLNQQNLIDEVSGIDTVPNEKKQHAVGGCCRGTRGPAALQGD